MASRKDFNKFFNGYVTCALWSSNDESDESGGEPFDKNYDSSDIAAESIRKMKSDCVKFMRANKKDLEEYVERVRNENGTLGWDRAGHDFWLTRCGHGAGFWDRNVDDLGERLTKSCKKFGDVNLYLGDDGKIYVS
jgi:hypothetical protein